MSRYVLLLLTACHSVVAAQNAACSSGLYKQLASYSVVKPVSSFCLSKFPPQTQTSFISTATTTTTTTTLIITVPTDTTVVSTSTVTEFTTSTITAPVANIKRVAKPSTTPVQNGKPATTSAQPCPELVALKLLAENIVATACSCIISTPTVTSTRTATLTASAGTTMSTTITNVITSTTTTTTTSISTVTATPLPVDDAPTCPSPATLGCSAYAVCGGGNSGSCGCEQTTEGRNVCINYVSQSCGASCTSSSQCGAGSKCVTSTCCGAGTCIEYAPGGNRCANVAAKMVRMLRGRTEKPPTIGYPFHLPPIQA